MADPDPLVRVGARCRELGVPLTLQRRAIYSLLAARHDHPTADEVHAALQASSPGTSKATTYRTLDKLVELGLVRRVSHPGAVARFDAKVHRHHHLVCDRCGAVSDLESAALDRVALPDVAVVGFQPRDFCVLIHGHCQRCARGGARAKAVRSGDRERDLVPSQAAARAARPNRSRPRRSR